MAVFDSFLIFSIFSAPFVGHPFQPFGVGTGGNPLRVSESVCGSRSSRNNDSIPAGIFEQGTLEFIP